MRALLALVALVATATVVVGRSVTAPAVTGPTERVIANRWPSRCTVSIHVSGVPTDVEASRDAVWVAAGMAGIVRVDPTKNRPVARIRPGGAVTALARGLGAVWALDLFGERLLRIDPRTNRVVRSTRIDPLPSAVAVGHGLVWVASQLESTVSGIDPRTGQVVKLARFARGELWPGGLAVDRTGVWVVTAAGNEVSVFDPETMTFRHRLRVPGARTLTATGRDAWVGVAGESTLLRIRDGGITRAPLDMPVDGYGPSLAAAGRVWVVEGDHVESIDPSGGAVVLHGRLPRGTEAGPVAVGGTLWTVDQRRRELLRLGACDREEQSAAPRRAPA